MSQDIKKHFLEASEFLRETESLIASGLYKASVGHAYYSMFHAAVAAMQANKIDRGPRQAIFSTFEDAFIKTGRLDKKFSNYLRNASRARNESDDTSSDASGHRQAQTILLRAKEFLAECRKLANIDESKPQD